MLLAAIGRGPSVIRNLPPGDDVARTKSALRALGVRVEGEGNEVRVYGEGWEGLKPPSVPLEAGNSGTTLRLLMGILAACPFPAIIETGEGLRKRPVDRVAIPLRKMGAKVWANQGGHYPPVVISGGPLRGIRYRMPVASAQVKSAVLLAGLRAKGRTTVVEPQPTRDHTERMLVGKGVRIGRKGKAITLSGGTNIQGGEMEIPGDLSSASFILAAAALVPGSAVRIRRCLLNPGRLAFVRFLERAGAATEIVPEGESCGEPWGTIGVRSGVMRPVQIRPEDVAPLIDELPLVGAVQAFAPGRSILKGAAELRVKETDRIRSLVGGLSAMGAEAKERSDGWSVIGGRTLRGAELDGCGDHRTAMALAVVGLRAVGDTLIRHPGIEKSFPSFPRVLNGLVSR